MAETIERLRYFDGEYLRSFDFAAEQNYHLEMRRRLHLALRLWGIADGLEIVENQEGTAKTFAVGPGVAIDAFGREIFVFNPYQLDDTVLASNLITNPGTYQLVIRYKLDPITPPSAGYGQCNGGNQFTRWQEHYEVLLLPQSWSLPTVEPEPTEPLSEKPKQDGWAVPLGTITLALAADGKTLLFTGSSENGRRYIGVRAQRIQPPVDGGAAFDITKAQTATSPPTSVEVVSNLYVDRNLIVGPNFDVTLGSSAPPAKGNLKLAGDLILQGRVFVNDNGTFTALQDFVASLQEGLRDLIPEIRSGTFDVVIPLNSAVDVKTGTTTAVAVPTTFQPGTYNIIVSAAVTGVVSRDKTTVDAVRALVGGGEKDFEYQITVNPSITATGCDLTFTWTIAPVKQMVVSGNNVFVSTIDKLIVSYVVTFTPNP